MQCKLLKDEKATYRSLTRAGKAGSWSKSASRGETLRKKISVMQFS